MLYFANLLPNYMSPISKSVCCNYCNNWTFERCSWETWQIWLVSSFVWFFFFCDDNFESVKHVPTPRNIVLISFSEAGKL